MDSKKASCLWDYLILLHNCQLAIIIADKQYIDTYSSYLDTNMPTVK